MKKPINVVAAILECDGKFLIGKRMAGDSNAGKWEFPGGKIEANETPTQALRREIMEELGIELGELDFFMEIHHEYPRCLVHIQFYIGHVARDRKFVLECHEEIAWLDLNEQNQFELLEANQPVIEKLKNQRFFLGLF